MCRPLGAVWRKTRDPREAMRLFDGSWAWYWRHDAFFKPLCSIARLLKLSVCMALSFCSSPLVYCILWAFTSCPTISKRCEPLSANIVCINRYSSVMFDDFYRNPINCSFKPTQDHADEATKDPGDSTWKLIVGADFLVFDRVRS